MTATMVAWRSVSAKHGAWWGTGAAFTAGSVSVIVVALFDWLMWRLDERALQKARKVVLHEIIKNDRQHHGRMIGL